MQRKAVKCVIAFEVVYGPCRAVACVTNYRMAGQFRMAPDLVRAARKQLDFHHRVMGTAVKDPVPGKALLPVSGTFGIVASAGGFGKSPVPCPPWIASFRIFQHAVQKSDIALFYLTGLKLVRKE